MKAFTSFLAVASYPFRLVGSIARWFRDFCFERYDSAQYHAAMRENGELRQQLVIARAEVAIIHAELDLKTLSMERMRASIEADNAVFGTSIASGRPIEHVVMRPKQ